MEDNVPVELRDQKEAQRRKISEGMKRSHALRRKLREQKQAERQRAPAGILAQLIKERDALNVVIESLRKRGVT